MFKTLCMHCIRSTCISFSLAYIFSICENNNNLQVDMETQSLAFFALRKILEEKLWCLFYGILNKCNYVLNTFCFWSVPYSLLKLVNCLLFFAWSNNFFTSAFLHSSFVNIISWCTVLRSIQLFCQIFCNPYTMQE